MNKTALWIILIVTSTWIGFMMGYAVSSHTGGKQLAERAPASESAGAGGYGK